MRASRAGDSMPTSRRRRVASAITSATVKDPTLVSDMVVSIRFGKQIRLMICYQCIDKLVQGAAVQDLIELVQSQIDAMIRDTSLWKIVCANPLRAIA